MINKKLYISLFLCIIAIFLFLGYAKQLKLINALTILVCVISFFYDKKFILFLFIIFLPTNGLISTDYNLFGLLNIKRVVNLFAILVLFNEKDQSNIEKDGHVKFAKTLLVFFLIYTCYTEYKNYMYQLSDTLDSFNTLINRFIKYFLLFYSSVLFIKNIKNEEINNIFNLAIIVGVIFMSITQIYSIQLYNLGFHTSHFYENVIGNTYANLYRSSGFFEYGDQNGLGAFLVMAIGYFLAKNEKEEDMLKLLVIVGIATLSIIKTGSRTAQIMLGLLFTVYFIRNWKSSKVLSLLLIGIFSIVVVIQTTPIFDSIFSRFGELQSESNSTDDTTRIYKWLTYLNFMLSDISYFLTGSKERIIVLAGRYRAAHNLYLQMLYNTGIFFLGYLLVLYGKFVNLTFSGKNYLFNPYYVFPFIAITMVTSEWVNAIFIAYYVGANYKIENENVLQ